MCSISTTLPTSNVNIVLPGSGQLLATVFGFGVSRHAEQREGAGERGRGDVSSPVLRCSDKHSSETVGGRKHSDFHFQVAVHNEEKAGQGLE